MKVTDLMIGDWVNMFGIPKQIEGIRKFRNGDEIVYYDGDNGNFIENVTPIPLTPEILEKNGFTKYNVGHNVNGWTIMDEDYCSDILFTLTDDDFDTNLGDYKWGPVEDDREESFVREMGRIKYVHELQHALKLCEIDKEIVL